MALYLFITQIVHLWHTEKRERRGNEKREKLNEDIYVSPL